VPGNKRRKWDVAGAPDDPGALEKSFAVNLRLPRRAPYNTAKDVGELASLLVAATRIGDGLSHVGAAAQFSRLRTARSDFRKSLPTLPTLGCATIIRGWPHNHTANLHAGFWFVSATTT